VERRQRKQSWSNIIMDLKYAAYKPNTLTELNMISAVLEAAIDKHIYVM
jgi:hypothetical protein